MRDNEMSAGMQLKLERVTNLATREEKRRNILTLEKVLREILKDGDMRLGVIFNELQERKIDIVVSHTKVRDIIKEIRVEYNYTQPTVPHTYCCESCKNMFSIAYVTCVDSLCPSCAVDRAIEEVGDEWKQETQAVPGSPEKIAILAKRYECGMSTEFAESIHLAGDRKLERTHNIGSEHATSEGKTYSLELPSVKSA